MKRLSISLPVLILLSTAAFAQPVNDDCTAATLVGLGATAIDTTGATLGPASPPTCQYFFEQDVWFEYIAFTDSVVQIDTVGSSFDTVIAAYPNYGCPVAVIDEIACSDNIYAGNMASRISFPVAAGFSYLIRLGGTSSGGAATSGPGLLNIVELQPPAHDECFAPEPLVIPDVATFNTAAAAPSGSFGCPFGADVWYEVTPDFDGMLVVEKDVLFHHAIYPIASPGDCPMDPSDEIYCAFQERTGTPVIGGQTYLIRVGNNIWAGPVIGTFTVDLLPFAGDDDCTNPTVVTPGSTIAIDTIAATVDPTILISCNPPPFGDEMVHGDRWFSVTPGSDGVLLVELSEDPEATPLHVVYQLPAGSTCPTLADEVNCSQPRASATSVSSGETYLVRVGNFTHEHFYSGDLTIDVIAPVANDYCTDATALTSGFPAWVDTTLASISSGYSCVIEGDVWYEITAPSDGFLQTTLTLDHIGSHVVYHAPGGSGSCPADADQLVCAAFQDVSTTPVTGGEVYMIRVSGTSFQGPVTGTISVEHHVTPPNDDCATPESLAVPPGSVFYNTIAATGTAGLSGCIGLPIVKDIWYEFTAPTSGELFLDFDSDVVHALYERPVAGGCPTDADLIFCQDAPDSSTTSIVAGQAYLIRVGHFDGYPGTTGILLASISGPPPNDDCSAGGPQPIPTIPASVSWDTTGATDDTTGLGGGPGCTFGPFNDVWYRVVAPAPGEVQFEFTVGGSGYSSFVIYEDSSAGLACPTDDDAIACQQGGDSAVFPVAAGQGYYIRVGRGGPLSTVLSGVFELKYVLSDPQSVVCDGSVPDQVTASYVVPVGSEYDLGVEVYVDGILEATIPQTQLSYTHFLPAGFIGLVEIGFRGLSSSGTTAIVSCDAAFGGPLNDLCVGALPVDLGTYPFDTTLAATDSTAPPFSCGDGEHDVWFEFVAAAHGLYQASTCGTAQYDTVIEIYDGTGGCPTAGSTALACNDHSLNCPLETSEVEWVADAGTTYYIRVGGGTGFLGSFGTGELTIQEDCFDLTGLTCTYDCAAGEVELTWDGGLHSSYEVHDSYSGLLASGLTQPYFTAPVPVTGEITYTVVGDCGTGGTSTAFCTVTVVDLTAPSTDLVLALEGTGGLIDSASAVATALFFLGKMPTLVPLTEFDQFECLDQLVDPVERIWVVTGTYPEAYALSAAEGDILAGLSASGKPVYLEGADHWGFQPVASLLDDRDGVDSADDGDDSFTAMDGADSGLPGGNFGGYTDVPYAQDSAGNDFTDQLVVTTTDPSLNAGAIWLNHSDSTPPEPAYVTGVLAVHTGDGGIVISSSWEFGGFEGDQMELMADYLDAMAPPVGTPFRRGDANGDGGFDISDAIVTLSVLFVVGTPPLGCEDAADSNDDGANDISDAVFTLAALFTPGSPLPPAPGAITCGVDPTADALGCDDTSSCP